MARPTTYDTVKDLFVIKGQCREPDGSYLHVAITRDFQHLADIGFSGEISAIDWLHIKARAIVAQWIKKWKITKKHKHPCFNKKINYRELATVYSVVWDAIADFKNFRAFTHANEYSCTSEWFAYILYELQLGTGSGNASGIREIVMYMQTSNRILTDIKNGRKDWQNIDKICNCKYAPHTYKFLKLLCRDDERLDTDMNEMRAENLEWLIKALKTYCTHVRRDIKGVIVPTDDGDRYIEGRGRGCEYVPNLLVNLETLASIGFYPSNDHFGLMLEKYAILCTTKEKTPKHKAQALFQLINPK